MADDATSAGAQAQTVGDQLLNELQAVVSARMTPTADASAGTRAIAHIRQAAEDYYWTPRRQLEQAIADRNTATARAAAAEKRIAELKQQVTA